MAILRIKASDEDIDQYYSELKSFINGMPSSMIVNIDETGFYE